MGQQFGQLFLFVKYLWGLSQEVAVAHSTPTSDTHAIEKPSKGIMKALGILCLLLFFNTGTLWAATYTAATCSYADVQSTLARAITGDTVIVPAGTCTWSNTLDSIGGLYGPPYDGSFYNKAITFKGGGAIPPVTSNTTLAQAQALCSASQTIYTCIYDGYNKGANVMQPNLLRWDLVQGGLSRITNFIFIGTGAPDPNNSGMIRLRGNSSQLRLDNNMFIGNGSTLVFIDGNIQGVGDHNFFNCDLTFCHYTFHTSWNPGSTGSGGYGDQSYASSLTIGTQQAWFWEDNRYYRQVLGSSPYCCDGWNGSRIVYRHNTYVCTVIDWHGTESGGRSRGTMQFEVYDNIWTCDMSGSSWPSLVGARSGTGIIQDNTITITNGSINAFFDIIDYRHDGNNSPVFGLCTGTNTWDQNTAGQSGRLCLDQAGVGNGDLITGDTPVNSVLGGQAWPRQGSVPFYHFNNLVNGVASTPVSHSGNVLLNRDYFLTAKPGYVKFAYPHPLVTASGNTASPPPPPQNLTVR